MRWRAPLPDSVSGWCFWASFVALLAVIGVSLAAPFVAASGANGAMNVLWKVVQFSFAALVAAFLLGVVCSLIRDIRGERIGGWRL